MCARPFPEIFGPIAKEALGGVKASAAIRHAFTGQLERRLAEMLSQCLFLRFASDRITAEVFDGSRTGCYARFIREVRRRSISDALREFPVAVEAIRVLCKQARIAAEEFAAHLKEDEAMIATLPGVRRTGMPVHVSAGWSDPHRHGRTVVKATFRDGGSVIYKPRSVAVDLVWRKGMERLSHALPLPLRTAAVLDCGDHGWSEVIRTVREVTKKEGHAFYFRYGTLLCLAWVLDGTDLHRDNLLICRGDPILVDLEGLLHPLGDGEDRSLAHTGLISDPGWGYDLSALGLGSRRGRTTEAFWKAIGEDDLQMGFRYPMVRGGSGLPAWNGVTFSPAAGASDLSAGFEAGVRALRSAGRFAGDWRAELNETPRRRIYRSTSEYLELLQDAARPRNLCSTAAWRRSLKPRPRSGTKPAILQFELEQLANWDVPRFENDSKATETPPWSGLGNRRKELTDYLKRLIQQADQQARLPSNRT